MRLIFIYKSWLRFGVKIFFDILNKCTAIIAPFGRIRAKNIVEKVIKLLYNINIYSKEVNYEDF